MNLKNKTKFKVKTVLGTILTLTFVAMMFGGLFYFVHSNVADSMLNDIMGWIALFGIIGGPVTMVYTYMPEEKHYD